MSLTQAFQKVLGSGLEDYHRPRYWDICGVKVQFKPVPNGVSASTWRDVLEKWLPKYEEVGWLDGLHKIRIGPNAAKRQNENAVGRYNHGGSIDLNNDIDLGAFAGLVHDGDREAVLTHEVIHHAHLSINGYENSRRSSNKEAMLKQDVSWYAGSNVGEAIAEIGTGIVHGEEFPSWVHEYYEEKRGPMEAYEIG